METDAEKTFRWLKRTPLDVLEPLYLQAYHGPLWPNNFERNGETFLIRDAKEQRRERVRYLLEKNSWTIEEFYKETRYERGLSDFSD